LNTDYPIKLFASQLLWLTEVQKPSALGFTTRSANKVSLKLLYEYKANILPNLNKQKGGSCYDAESLDLAVPTQKYKTPESGKGRLRWENSSFLPARTLLKWKLVIQSTCSLCVHSYNTLIQPLTYFK